MKQSEGGCYTGGQRRARAFHGVIRSSFEIEFPAISLRFEGRFKLAIGPPCATLEFAADANLLAARKQHAGAITAHDFQRHRVTERHHAPKTPAENRLVVTIVDAAQIGMQRAMMAGLAVAPGAAPFPREV